MKKYLLPFFFLPVACFFPPTGSFAQSTAIIGTGTSFNDPYTYPAPYGNFYWGAKHQILVRASEMTAAGMSAGNITALAFEVNTPGGSPLSGFTIRMKATSNTSTNTNFDFGGFTTVFGPQTVTDVSGWNTHTFTTPFAWNGTSNVLIQVCFNNTNWSQNAEMYYTATSYNSVTCYYQDMNNVCSQSTGTTYMNRPNIKFTFTPNGPPTAQFTANPTASCSGNIQFTDQSFYGITSWSWNFGDGGTSTLQNPAHTYTASGVYSVTLTVTNPNGNNTLVKPNYISVNLGSGPIVPSCTPQTTAYCCGFGITNFQFNNINNSSADASEGYADFSCAADTVTSGQYYPVSVTTQTPASHNVRVWIDFNNDGTFNASTEQVFAADNSLISNGTVYIPGTAVTNAPLRMRVSADHSLNPVPTPCGNVQYGQAEDYAIWVKPNTSPPVANFKADDTLSCSGNIQFTDLSLNVPVAWNWNFGDGNSSNLQNPSHTYTASGTYSVSLTATNGNGNNTLVKTNYIDVTLGNTPIAPSCQPATFSYCCGYGIYKVIFNTINKSSQDGSEGYQDFSCTDQTTVTEGQAYNMSIQTGSANVQDTKVWIDYNNDGVFSQPSELVLDKPNAINPSGNISIPTGVAVLNTLLRMRVSSDNGGSNPGPCSSLIRGQAEDYGITILQFVGIDEASAVNPINVFPNPSTGIFNMQFYFQIHGATAILEIINALGEKIYEADISAPVINHKIDLSGKPKGIYFYTLRCSDATLQTGKLIIQ